MTPEPERKQGRRIWPLLLESRGQEKMVEDVVHKVGNAFIKLFELPDKEFELAMELMPKFGKAVYWHEPQFKEALGRLREEYKNAIEEDKYSVPTYPDIEKIRYRQAESIRRKEERRLRSESFVRNYTEEMFKRRERRDRI